MILPSKATGVLREEWRLKDIDKVFTTISIKSAEMYAKKSAKKYGGKPVVYIVKPTGNVEYRINGEFISTEARVISKL